MYTDTTEEERYLLGIRNEQEAFEILIREQGVLVAPTEYEVSRDNCSQLRRFTLKRDSRDAEPDEEDYQQKVNYLIKIKRLRLLWICENLIVNYLRFFINEELNWSQQP